MASLLSFLCYYVNVIIFVILFFRWHHAWLLQYPLTDDNKQLIYISVQQLSRSDTHLMCLQQTVSTVILLSCQNLRVNGGFVVKDQKGGKKWGDNRVVEEWSINEDYVGG